MKTLVIGAAIIDIIMKIKRLPKSGEDILCSETMSAVGGCAYNVAGTLRGFGVDHDLFVPVGRGMYCLLYTSGSHPIGRRAYHGSMSEPVVEMQLHGRRHSLFLRRAVYDLSLIHI